MKRLDRILDKFEEYACFVLLMVMSFAILAQIVNRAFLGRPFPWGEELARYLMIWATFIGISAGVKMGSHIGVEALVALLPERMRLRFAVGTDVAILSFFVVMTFLSVQLVAGIKETGQLSPALRVPMWYAYMAIPVGFFLSCFRQIQLLMQKIARLSAG